MADKPVTREEKYLAYLTGDYTGEIPKPITRKEKYLYELCLKGMGGEISPEEIKAAVNEYLEKNPVKPGATTEQAQQIEKNKTDVALLKEDLSNKITKFYASNQGETHLQDSDNGKIQDMMIYGKSSQDGTPSVENPVEIKSVVNPTVKVRGKNLLKATLRTTTRNGVTCTANGDGTYVLNGTANKSTSFKIGEVDFNAGKSYRLTGWNSLISYIKDQQGLYVDEIYQFDSGTGNNFKVPQSKEYAVIVIIQGGTSLNNIIIKPMITTDLTATYDDYEPYHEQTVTLPYTLNAIPVSSGGNVTIDGQQYIADYVDVERGKLVRCVKKLFLKQHQWSKAINKGVLRFYASTIDAVGIAGNKVMKNAFSISSHFAFITGVPDRIGTFITNADGTNANIGFAFSADTTTSSDDFNNWILNNKPFVLLPVLKEELPLTSEQTQALKELATYYPVTNISVNSEQLDGYTVFNYPISMENGWNYVKQQIGDTREYIYNMDARTQDTDLQAAEAYVNSEYAVALTELEV